MTFSHNYTAYVSVSVCVFVIMCIYLHVHSCVKNQNRGRWLLGAFAEWLLLISGSCGAQWHMQQYLNTAWMVTWHGGYTEAIHSSAAIFIHEQECMEWPARFDPDFLLEWDRPWSDLLYHPDCQRSQVSTHCFTKNVLWLNYWLLIGEIVGMCNLLLICRKSLSVHGQKERMRNLFEMLKCHKQILL